VLAREQAEPRCHVPTILEFVPITDGGNYRGRDLRPDTPNGGHPAAGLVLAENTFYALIELVDARIDLVQKGKKTSEHLAAELGQIVVPVGKDLGNHPAGKSDRLRETDTTVEQDALHQLTSAVR